MPLAQGIAPAHDRAQPFGLQRLVDAFFAQVQRVGGMARHGDAHVDEELRHLAVGVAVIGRDLHAVLSTPSAAFALAKDFAALAHAFLWAPALAHGLPACPARHGLAGANAGEGGPRHAVAQ